MGQMPISPQRGSSSARRVDGVALASEARTLPCDEIADDSHEKPQSFSQRDAAMRQRRIAMLLEHRRRILSRIRLLLRNEDDALDLLQDVGIAALMSPID